MSIRAMSAVFELPDGVGPIDRCILLAMADHADDDGYCFPSIARICSKAGVSEATIKRHRAKLLEDELLEKVGSVHARSVASKIPACARWLCVPSARRPALYRLTFVGGAERALDGPRGRTAATRGGAHDATRGRTAAPLTIIQPSGNPLGGGAELAPSALWDLDEEQNMVRGGKPIALEPNPEAGEPFDDSFLEGIDRARRSVDPVDRHG